MNRLIAGIALPVQVVVFILLLLFFVTKEVRAQEVDRFSETQVTVPLFKSVVLDLKGNANRVSLGNPDVADILILRANQLYVLGKDLGTTNVILWDSSDNLVGNVAVEVTHDLENLKQKLHTVLPGEPIEVYSAQRSIVLRGTVSSPGAMQSALDIADGYLAQIQTSTQSQQFEQESQSKRDDKSVGEVINMLQVGGAQQVMLEVKVAEIARRELKRLSAQFNAMGIGDQNWNFGGVNGGAAFPDVVFEPQNIRDPITGLVTQIPGGRRAIFGEPAPWGPAIDEFAPTPMNIQDQGLWASFLTNNTLFNLAIDAAKEQGLAKILAEPTLTTLTGQEASFVSGGEFPVPVPRGDDGVTIEFREFGVVLKCLPIVLGSGNINVRLNIEVSEPVTSNSLGITAQGVSSSFIVPTLAKRGAHATVELQEGQTIALAGLISENLREIVTKFPGLGDIPVLGALFRSQQFINDETELVIVVTPRLAKPLRPDQIKLPTDHFVEPSDAEFYLMGRMEGRRRHAAPNMSAAADDQNAQTATLAQQGHQIQ